MPLKCLRGEEELFSFDFDSESAWKDLRKSNAEMNNLRMHCCGAHVVLKTSPLGTRYFAHAKRGPCVTAPETVEHLLAKKKIVEGIKRTIWSAKTEQEGVTPDGERWRADVLATKGSVRVAIEVQWSKQEGEETFRRQSKYADAGVRGLWLFRQHDFPVSEFIPAFRLVFDDKSKCFFVLLPSPRYSPKFIKVKNRDDACYWMQRVCLEDFAEGVVLGRLKYSPAVGRELPLDIFVKTVACYKCKAKTKLVTRMVFAASRIFPNHQDIPVNFRDLGGLYAGPEMVTAWLPPSLLKKYDIGPLKVRRSRLDIEGREPYLSNGCVKCDAMQAKWLESRLDIEEEFALTVDVLFDYFLATQLPYVEHIIERWYFEERPG